jgi:hypothetical protein
LPDLCQRIWQGAPIAKMGFPPHLKVKSPTNLLCQVDPGLLLDLSRETSHSFSAISRNQAHIAVPHE